jgi:hypothetical protein
MFDFFISHSSKDDEWVGKLVEALEEKTKENPLFIWYDENNLSPGDFILQKIEDGIVNSKHIGVVLTPDSVASDWVRFERMIFQTADPLGRQKKLIPLLLKDCEIPISLKAIKQIDFRNEQNFAEGVDQLLCVLQRPIVQEPKWKEEIEGLIQNAKIFNPNTGKYIYQLKNQDSTQIYQWIESLNKDDSHQRNEIEQIIFDLLAYDDYLLTMTVSEFVASLVLTSTAYNWLISKMIGATDWNVIMAGVRTYSKLAEIDEDLVDISELIKLSLRLDSKPMLSSTEKTASIHLIRTIGKINRHANGESIIRYLSTKGPISKEIAANSIAFDFSNNGPMFMTNLLKGKSNRVIESVPPTKEQLAILIALSQDSNFAVWTCAVDVINQVKETWNVEIDRSSVKKNRKEISTGGSVHFSQRAPFSGFLRRANSTNQFEIQENLSLGTVVLIETDQALEFLFRDASGIIVDLEARLSHRSLRLMNLGTPHASIDQKFLKDIPDGTFISVNENSFELELGRPRIL